MAKALHNNKRRRSSSFLAGVGLGLAGLGFRRALRRYAVKRLTAPPRVLGAENPSDFGLPYEEVYFLTRDKLKLHGWHIPAENSKATIIIAHGYSGCKAPDLRHARWLREGGYSVFMFDFRGHGRSDGPRGTSMGYMERLDLHAAVDYLLGRGERKIGLYGISMGAAAGIIAAGENPHISAVVADCPYAHLFRSISTEVNRLYRLPEWLSIPVARFAFKAMSDYHGYKADEAHPVRYIRKISPRPLFLIHGGSDSLTRVQNSEILYALAGEPKQLWIEPEVEHAAMYDYNPAEYQRRVLEFFNAVDWQAAEVMADQGRWEGQKEVVTLDGRFRASGAGRAE